MQPHRTAALFRRAVGMVDAYRSRFMLYYLYFSPLSGSSKENIKNKPKQNIKIKWITKYL